MFDSLIMNCRKGLEKELSEKEFDHMKYMD